MRAGEPGHTPREHLIFFHRHSREGAKRFPAARSAGHPAPSNKLRKDTASTSGKRAQSADFKSSKRRRRRICMPLVLIRMRWLLTRAPSHSQWQAVGLRDRALLNRHPREGGATFQQPQAGQAISNSANRRSSRDFSFHCGEVGSAPRQPKPGHPVTSSRRIRPRAGSPCSLPGPILQHAPDIPAPPPQRTLAPRVVSAGSARYRNRPKGPLG